jgi:hypothetical protein
MIVPLTVLILSALILPWGCSVCWSGGKHNMMLIGMDHA